MDNRQPSSGSSSKSTFMSLPSRLHASIRTSLAAAAAATSSRLGQVRRAKPPEASAEEMTCRRRPDVTRVGSSGRSGRVEDTWEVYICHRALQSLGSSFYQSLPDSAKAELRDLGLCHYMVVLRRVKSTRVRKPAEYPSPPSSLPANAGGLLWDFGGTPFSTGRMDLQWEFLEEEDEEEVEEEELIQLDFGPRGLDIVWNARESLEAVTAAESRKQRQEEGYPRVSEGSDFNLASLTTTFPLVPVAWQEPLQNHPSSTTARFSPVSQGQEVRARRKPATGEVRETRLERLPATSELMGTGTISLEDIRMFNHTLDWDYALNRNDCRHYVDSLVQHMTGIDRACARFMRAKAQQRLKERPSQLSDPLRHMAQLALEKDSSDLLLCLRSSLLGQSSESPEQVNAKIPTPPEPSKPLAAALQRVWASKALLLRRNATLQMESSPGLRGAHQSLPGNEGQDELMSPVPVHLPTTTPSQSRQQNTWTNSMLTTVSVSAASLSAGAIMSRFLRRWTPTRSKRHRTGMRPSSEWHHSDGGLSDARSWGVSTLKGKQLTLVAGQQGRRFRLPGCSPNPCVSHEWETLHAVRFTGAASRGRPLPHAQVRQEVIRLRGSGFRPVAHTRALLHHFVF